MAWIQNTEQEKTQKVDRKKSILFLRVYRDEKCADAHSSSENNKIQKSHNLGNGMDTEKERQTEKDSERQREKDQK